MKILGLETSCDETSASIVENGQKVLSNVVISQIKSHKKYGGVVPEVASRKHTDNISFVLDKCFKDAELKYDQIDAIAVSNKPGLFGALIVGVTTAKTMAYLLDKPLIGVNHVIAHVYANYLNREAPQFPYICLIVSGGHTFIAHMKNHFEYEIIGRTLDDAAGEAYDKVARFLGLSYPGGPVIDKLSKQGDPDRFPFPRAMMGEGYDFSFSGLKTAVINKVHNMTPDPLSLDENTVCDLAAGFQESVVNVLGDKTISAAKSYNSKRIVLAGGVSANSRLRNYLSEQCLSENIELHIPELKFCTDNGAMIASGGYYKYQKGQTDNLDLKIEPGFSG